MIKVLTFLLLFSSLDVFAQDLSREKLNEDLQKYRRKAPKKTDAEIEEEAQTSIAERFQMSSKWSRGRFLIYDCVDQHFACVSGEGRKKCRKLRQNAMDLKETDLLPCAPLKTFTRYEECHKGQDFWMGKNFDQRICSLKSVLDARKATQDSSP